MEKQITILDLNYDVFYIICSMVKFPDQLNLRATSKYINSNVSYSGFASGNFIKKVDKLMVSSTQLILKMNGINAICISPHPKYIGGYHEIVEGHRQRFYAQHRIFGSDNLFDMTEDTFHLMEDVYLDKTLNRWKTDKVWLKRTDKKEYDFQLLTTIDDSYVGFHCNRVPQCTPHNSVAECDCYPFYSRPLNKIKNNLCVRHRLYYEQCTTENHLCVSINHEKYYIVQLVENISLLIGLECIGKLIETTAKINECQDLFISTHCWLVTLPYNELSKNYRKTHNAYLQYERNITIIFNDGNWEANLQKIICGNMKMIDWNQAKRIMEQIDVAENIIEQYKSIYASMQPIKSTRLKRGKKKNKYVVDNFFQYRR